MRWSPGSKLEPCMQDPKLRDSLLWGGSGWKPPRVWFVGVSPALRQTFSTLWGPGHSQAQRGHIQHQQVLCPWRGQAPSPPAKAELGSHKHNRCYRPSLFPAFSSHAPHAGALWANQGTKMQPFEAGKRRPQKGKPTLVSSRMELPRLFRLPSSLAPQASLSSRVSPAPGYEY